MDAYSKLDRMTSLYIFFILGTGKLPQFLDIPADVKFLHVFHKSELSVKNHYQY